MVDAFIPKSYRGRAGGFRYTETWETRKPILSLTIAMFVGRKLDVRNRFLVEKELGWNLI